MAIDLTTVYPSTNIDTSDPTNYPWGKAKNETFDGAKDYFPLEKTWVNEIFGFFAAILYYYVPDTPDGTPETAVSSQYLTKLNSMPVSVSRLADGSTSLPSSTINLGGSTYGRLEITGNPTTYSTLRTNSETAKTYDHNVTLTRGGITFNHTATLSASSSLTCLLIPIEYSEVTFFSGAYFNYIKYLPTLGYHDFTGVQTHFIRDCTLVLWNSSTDASASMNLNSRFTDNGSGILRLVENEATNLVGAVVGDFDSAFIQMWVNPTYII